MSSNLSTYENTLSSNCALHTKHELCIGPLWNVSAWEEFVVQGRSSFSGEVRARPHYNYMSRNYFDSIEAIDTEIAHLQRETALRLKELQEKRAELQVIQGLVPLGNGSLRRGFNSSYIFQFETRSSPAVFLISVDPVGRSHRLGEDPPHLTASALDEEHEGRHWNLEVKRVDPPPSGMNFAKAGFGTRIMTIEDMSQEAVNAVREHGHIRREAILRNLDMSAYRTRFVVFVEDFQSPHIGHSDKLTKLYGSQCSLTASWRAFNRQHQGHRHRSLTLCRDLLGWLLPLGAIATWVSCQTNGDFKKTEWCPAEGWIWRKSSSYSIITGFPANTLPNKHTWRTCFAPNLEMVLEILRRRWPASKAVYARSVARTEKGGLEAKEDDVTSIEMNSRLVGRCFAFFCSWLVNLPPLNVFPLANRGVGWVATIVGHDCSRSLKSKIKASSGTNTTSRLWSSSSCWSWTFLSRPWVFQAPTC